MFHRIPFLFLLINIFSKKKTSLSWFLNQISRWKTQNTHVALNTTPYAARPYIYIYIYTIRTRMPPFPTRSRRRARINNGLLRRELKPPRTKWIGRTKMFVLIRKRAIVAPVGKKNEIPKRFDRLRHTYVYSSGEHKARRPKNRNRHSTGVMNVRDCRRRAEIVPWETRKKNNNNEIKQNKNV